MSEKKIPLPPLEVSPLIKLIRWSCLICGVIYGFTKRRQHATVENMIRKKEEEERPIREAALLREKLERNAVELKNLEEIFFGPNTSEKETTLNEEITPNEATLDKE